jgi:hypothetical protein
MSTQMDCFSAADAVWTKSHPMSTPEVIHDSTALSDAENECHCTLAWDLLRVSFPYTTEVYGVEVQTGLDRRCSSTCLSVEQVILQGQSTTQ